MIEFECPKCSSRMSAPAARVGQGEGCPSCGQLVIVPATLPPPPPLMSSAPADSSVVWPPNAALVYTIGGGVALSLGVLLCLGGVMKLNETMGGGNGVVMAICGSVFAAGGASVMAIGAVIGYLSRLCRLTSKEGA